MNESIKIPSETLGVKTFDEQFKTRKGVELYGERVEFIDLIPEEQKSETPVFVAPG
jgi:hypothetical protein